MGGGGGREKQQQQNKETIRTNLRDDSNLASCSCLIIAFVKEIDAVIVDIVADSALELEKQTRNSSHSDKFDTQAYVHALHTDSQQHCLHHLRAMRPKANK